MIRRSTVVPKPSDGGPGGAGGGAKDPDEVFQSCFKKVSQWPRADKAATDMAGLESRLEDWMRRVDTRLETLLEAQRSKSFVEEAKNLGLLKDTSDMKRGYPSPFFNSFASHKDVERADVVMDFADVMTTPPHLDKGGSTTSPTQSGSASPKSHRTTGTTNKTHQGMSKEEARKGLSHLHREVSVERSLRESILYKREVERREALQRVEEDASGVHTMNPVVRCHVRLHMLVLSDYFDYTVSVALVINALLIGVGVQCDATGMEHNSVLDVLEWAFAAFFALELMLRILGRGKDFCKEGERAWAFIDIALVVASIVDLGLGATPDTDAASTSFSSLGYSGRLLKVVRMLRILRLLRMVRFLSELRVMTHMIRHSMTSLFWLFTLLFILIYIFAIVLTQGATEFLKESPDDTVSNRYGSLFATMYSLFQAMSGGVSWGDVTSPLISVGWFYFFISLAFMFFSIFSVLNIVTGVFVDGAIELAKQDRSLIVAKTLSAREASATSLRELLGEMDSDGDRTLSEEEFFLSLRNGDIKEYFDALSVDPSEAQMLWILLDKDGSGCVDIDEFVDGMQRLQGEAKNFDIHMLMYATRQLLDECHRICAWVGSEGAPQSSRSPPQ